MADNGSDNAENNTAGQEQQGQQQQSVIVSKSFFKDKGVFLKVIFFFLFLKRNIYCGYSKEPSQ